MHDHSSAQEIRLGTNSVVSISMHSAQVSLCLATERENQIIICEMKKLNSKSTCAE